MKKISWLTHWYLGLCLGLAPVATEVVIRERISTETFLLCFGVAFWVAGFDLIYSLQDMQFDRKHKLKSVPALFGHKVALTFSVVSYIFALVCFRQVGIISLLSWPYDVGLIAIAGLMGWQHFVVRDAWSLGTSKGINLAFFNCNAVISVTYLSACIANWWVVYGA